MRRCAYVDEARGVLPHDFDPKRYDQKYCTPAHQIAAHNARVGADDARRNASNAKRRKLPLPKKSKCQLKGVPAHWFKPKRGDQKYCRVEHRLAAKNARDNARHRKHPVPAGKRRCKFKGVKPHWFTPKSRMGKDGVNRGIYPGQDFCSEKHRLSEHSRRWNQRHPEKRQQIDARTNARKRELRELGRKLQAARKDPKKILRAMITLCFALRPEAGNLEVREMFLDASKASDATINRAATEAGVKRKNRTTAKN